MDAQVRDNAAELQAEHDKLTTHGYVPIDEINGIRVGDRVRNYGEQYDSARREGTATVRAILEKRESPWSRKWEQRDVEVIVERDEHKVAQGFAPVGVWADYGTRAIDPDPSAASERVSR